jgi:aminoglycoside 2'-N-acetyltransferase I
VLRRDRRERGRPLAPVRLHRVVKVRPVTSHTADLDARRLDAIRRLLDAAFTDDPLDAHDWEHALGGIHAVVWDGDAAIAHAAVVMRRLLHGGRALRCGYVEAVAVHPDHRGRGHAATVMGEVERVIRGAYDLGALGTTDMARGFYAARGWVAWRGPLSALTPGGVVRTADEDGWILVLEGAVPLDLDGALTCDHRDGSAW